MFLDKIFTELGDKLMTVTGLKAEQKANVQAMMAKKKKVNKRCGKCKKIGHNRATCTKKGIWIKKKAKKSATIAKKKAKKRKKVTKDVHTAYLEDAVRINPKTNNGSSLIEAYSKSSPMPEFVLLSLEGNQIGPWMRCKDYIQDCIWGGMFGKTYNCHGFGYTHGKDPKPNLENLHLGMRFLAKTQQLEEMLENVKETVHDLEERVGIPPEERTRFSSVIKDKFNYFIVYGSKHWLKATHTISFFTFLLRGSFQNKKRKIETIGKTPPCKNDTYYFNSGKKYMKMLSDGGINGVKSNWDKHKDHNDPYQLHEGGFVNWSYSNGASYADKTKIDDDWEF